MTRGVLLDANLIMEAFDHEGTAAPEIKAKAKQRMTELLSDPDLVVAITPLIRYEVLRGVAAADAVRHQALADALTQFETYEIRAIEANLAADLWRYAVSRGQKPARRSFDVVHIASARANNLEVISSDGDIAKLLSLYDEMKKVMN